MGELIPGKSRSPSSWELRESPESPILLIVKRKIGLPIGKGFLIDLLALLALA
jgi:hypothetical protein